jgi:peroxiredoxin
MKTSNNLTGKEVASATFKVMEKGNWKDLTTLDTFKNKRVIVFALPGAATPTCSTSHLPKHLSKVN